ncbi:MAG: hypothetical protein JXA30_21500 [Deltaproteobacteria bacterium]|nr:hypothetical protein [Deltaproteobacteria bacterium]
MGSKTISCPYCGTILDEDIRFCSECGKPTKLVDGDELEPKFGNQPVTKGTIVGFQSPLADVGAEERESPGVQRPTEPGMGRSTPSRDEHMGSVSQRPERGKTMIGIPSQFEPIAGTTKMGAAARKDQLEKTEPSIPPEQPAEDTPSEAVSDPSRKESGYAKTMIGIAPGTIPAIESKRAKPTPAVSSGGTVLGLPAADGLDLQQPSPRESEQRPDEPESVLKPDTTAEKVPSVPPPDTGRTMLGVAQTPAAKSRPERTPSPLRSEYEHKRKKHARKSGARPITTLFVVALVLAVSAAAGYLYLQERKSKVQARVVSLDEGEGMQFDVPGAANGSKIRFGGQEQSLVAGRATFRLAPDSLRVGSNMVLVDYIDPKGKVEAAKIVLDVDFRIRVDKSALQTDPPAIDVIVDAHPGTRVTLDGEELELDAKGRGVRRFPIDAASASTSGIIEKVVRYRVQPPDAEAVVDEIRTKVPVATMQIDRPGSEAITDKASIEIAGAVAPNALVTIDGKEIALRAARFLYQFPMPNPGTYKPRLIAREPGKAPQARTLVIKRVKDLREEAESFKADSKLTFARISQNPSIYSGQKVEMVARVYNVNVQEGKSVLQVLVRECPSGTRCSLWVTYPAATDIVVNSWIRVLGVIEGEQQFRSENGQVVTVPKVAAAFILPAER